MTGDPGRTVNLIFDLLQRAPGAVEAFDVCVVGAGPAGITLATELIGSGLKVCLVESGGLDDEPEAQALNVGESIGLPARIDTGRHRVFGGSATRWGGRCAALDRIDFEPRDWIHKSGWPITFDHLQPFYERAKRSSNLSDDWISDEAALQKLGIEPPNLDAENVAPFVWRIARRDKGRSLSSLTKLGYREAFDWGVTYRRQLETDANTTVILHANLTDFQVSSDGAVVEAITVATLTGRKNTIRARAFVLCCGGIENARLLLNGPAALLDRVNEFDNLGRYLGQHPRGTVATVDANLRTARRLQRTFNHFLRPERAGTQYEVGFALSEQAQRTHGLVNASAAVYYDAPPLSPWKAAKRLRAAALQRAPYSGMARDALQLASGIGEVSVNSTRRVLLGRQIVHGRPTIKIEVDLEQEPNPDSRVMLSTQLDALGLKQAKIDWRISPIERRTARFFCAFLVKEFTRLELGTVRPTDWLENIDGDKGLWGNYHFIGATRMSEDPRQGVVDPDCRAHGVANLYFAGSSVFPTGGHANPTFTIVALAIRLADHLRAKVTSVSTAETPASRPMASAAP